MRKASILLAFVFFATFLAFAQDEDFSKVKIEVTKVAGTVYMLKGAAATSAPRSAKTASSSSTTSTLLWPKDPGRPQGRHRQAGALHHQYSLPRRSPGGNAFFQKQAPIIAHDNVRKRLETGGAAGNRSVPSPWTQGCSQRSAPHHHIRSRRHRPPEWRRHPRAAFSSGHTDGDSDHLLPQVECRAHGR